MTFLEDIHNTRNGETGNAVFEQINKIRDHQAIPENEFWRLVKETCKELEDRVSICRGRKYNDQIHKKNMGLVERVTLLSLDKMLRDDEEEDCLLGLSKGTINRFLNNTKHLPRDHRMINLFHQVQAKEITGTVDTSSTKDILSHSTLIALQLNIAKAAYYEDRHPMRAIGKDLPLAQYEEFLRRMNLKKPSDRRRRRKSLQKDPITVFDTVEAMGSVYWPGITKQEAYTRGSEKLAEMKGISTKAARTNLKKGERWLLENTSTGYFLWPIGFFAGMFLLQSKVFAGSGKRNRKKVNQSLTFPSFFRRPFSYALVLMLGVLTVPLFLTGPMPPQAQIRLTVRGTVVSFQDASTDDGTIASREWDIGDGSEIISKQNFNHIYKPGRYLITLTVIDDDGLSQKTTKSIEINAPDPVFFVKSEEQKNKPALTESDNAQENAVKNAIETVAKKTKQYSECPCEENIHTPIEIKNKELLTKAKNGLIGVSAIVIDQLIESGLTERSRDALWEASEGTNGKRTYLWKNVESPTDKELNRLGIYNEIKDKIIGICQKSHNLVYFIPEGNGKGFYPESGEIILGELGYPEKISIKIVIKNLDFEFAGYEMCILYSPNILEIDSNLNPSETLRSEISSGHFLYTNSWANNIHNAQGYFQLGLLVGSPPDRPGPRKEDLVLTIITFRTKGNVGRGFVSFNYCNTRDIPENHWKNARDDTRCDLFANSDAERVPVNYINSVKIFSSRCDLGNISRCYVDSKLDDEVDFLDYFLLCQCIKSNFGDECVLSNLPPKQLLYMADLDRSGDLDFFDTIPLFDEVVFRRNTRTNLSGWEFPNENGRLLIDLSAIDAIAGMSEFFIEDGAHSLLRLNNVNFNEDNQHVFFGQVDSNRYLLLFENYGDKNLPRLEIPLKGKGKLVLRHAYYYNRQMKKDSSAPPIKILNN